MSSSRTPGERSRYPAAQALVRRSHDPASASTSHPEPGCGSRRSRSYGGSSCGGMMYSGQSACHSVRAFSSAEYERFHPRRLQVRSFYCIQGVHLFEFHRHDRGRSRIRRTETRCRRKPSDTEFDAEPLRVSIEEIDRHGPGLLVDYRHPGGGQFVSWVE